MLLRAKSLIKTLTPVIFSMFFMPSMAIHTLSMAILFYTSQPLHG